ncbi:hypothetical protein HBI82_076360 [Parastagonospora nodorum]|nr:hypothetical protein HBH51_131000 [Parastagonospora nodorum]KAH4863651.1 hypothetical protein HBH75_004870 [Parastagonospora nodorum]KAH6023037.1 hypothetical protein HBI82_076360 [Parastagonospora nodorum]KAH6214113.1 hypothetical protein HBI43_138590 [Parastagonospora nodorum]KAH6252549.1 hypothetical protein HBI42_143580 [Parastagonospora nodorum]
MESTPPNTDTDSRLHAFPFLHLPPELRLIVYEVVFATVTRTHHELECMSTGPQASHPCLAQKHNKPAASVIFVYEAHNVALLATCHQIYSEAGVYALPALKTLQQRPRKIIVTTSGMDCDILGYLVRLSRSTQEVRCLAQSDHQLTKSSEESKQEVQPDTQTTEVQIAIRNDFHERTVGDHGTTEDLWTYLRMYMLRLHYDKLLYEAQQLSLQALRWPAHNLDVHFRMALMSPREKEEFDAEPWLENSIANDGEFPMQIQSGEEIESVEWDKDWAPSVPAAEYVANDFEERNTSLFEQRLSVARAEGFIHAVSAYWKAVCGRWSGRKWLD